MDHEKDAFYVVKKRDIVGVYKCLNDCQALLGSSVCDPSVSVFKGYGLPKEAEDYLVSNGLKNAVYSVVATAVQDHLFGELSVCPFQDLNSAADVQAKLAIDLTTVSYNYLNEPV